MLLELLCNSSVALVPRVAFLHQNAYYAWITDRCQGARIDVGHSLPRLEGQVSR